jgi:prepilin-type N-terminal cleavage/methylation domain-containing protein
MPDLRRGSRRGFALPELAAVVAVVALTLAVALPAARRARLAGWGAVDSENLHRFAAGTTAYAADNGDRYWGFSWRRAMEPGEELPTEYEDLKTKNDSDLRAAVAQAIDILRRKAGREDINYISNWFAHSYYSALPLYDYVGQEMPALWGVSPADRFRVDWSQDPAGFDQGVFLPCQPVPSNDNKRWPYSSSYQLPTAFFDQGAPGNRVEQAQGAQNFYTIPGLADLFAYRLADTAFPSQKVHLHAGTEQHLGEYADDCEAAAPDGFYRRDSRVVGLFADGHSGLMTTSDANPGWQPNHPESPEPTLLSDDGVNFYPGVYRWTRNGIFGRDFGGPEVGPP